MKPEFVYGANSLQDIGQSAGSVIAIGAFDGIHLGHQAILKQAVDKGRELGLPATALLFEPLPREYFNREGAPARLQPLRDKVKAIFDCGVDRVVCLRFNAALSALAPEAFVKNILVDGLAAKQIIVGEDFRFGSNRTGDKELMDELAQRHGFAIARPTTVEIGGERVSSTRIRALLNDAQFDQVRALLGRPYTMSGRVCYGKQLGRQLGVPTANFALRRRRSPLLGTFAVKVRVGQVVTKGVANIGVRPTVNRIAKPQLEAHLFDFDQSLYGQMIEVEFCLKLRDEKKFDSVEQLRQQIENDFAEAKVFFNQK